MFSAVRQQFQPRLARGISQVLADPTAWNQPHALITRLPNGLRVATKESFGDVSSVGVFVDAGVRDETAATAGATGLIQRLALTGTANRPKAKLELEVELMGAELAVEAGREKTAYTMSLQAADVEKGVDILADLVASPGLSGFAKEKASALRGLEEAEAPTRAVLDDRLHTCAFRDCSLGFSALGPFEGMESMTEEQLRSYVNANYTADKMVLAATGPVKHDELVKFAAASFGGFRANAPRTGDAKPYFCGAELIYRNDEMGPTAYVTVGWEGVPHRSPDAVTFMVMQHIIGSYKRGAGLVPGTISGNRTANAVANKMGVGCAEEFEAFNLSYKDTGMFGFYAACDEVAVEHCVGELMFGVNVLSHSVTDEEVARGRRELKAKLFGGSGSAAAACNELGSQILAYGRYIPPAEMALRIDAVDAEEVKRVAWKYLNDNEVAVTALGPLHGMPQYLDLRRATMMHRY